MQRVNILIALLIRISAIDDRGKCFLQEKMDFMMRLIAVFIFVLGIFTAINTKTSYAESEADCAIWICLPGGFPTGCSAAYSAFRDRIKHRKPPLPDLSSCTNAPNGEWVAGNYDLGRETFETCRSGYVLREKIRNSFPMGKCYLSQCAPERYLDANETYCQNYEAVRRKKQSYVKMWVDGDYLGQFWYQ